MKKNEKKTLTSRLSHNVIFLENIAQSKIDSPNWQKKFQTFAEVIPLSDCNYINLEGFSFGNFITEEYYVFKIRYMEALSKDMQIKHREQLYTIKRILNVHGQDRMLNVIAHLIG